MKDNPDIVRAPQPGAPDTASTLPWFTADELPMPPPHMRRPPEKEADPGLFDNDEED